MRHRGSSLPLLTAVLIVGVAGSALAQSRDDIGARAPGAAAIAGASAGASTPAVLGGAIPNEGWATRTALPARWAHATASYTTGAYPTNNAFLLAISGNDATFATTTAVTQYDVTAAAWTPLAPIPQGRSQISAARVGNRVFVPGGYVGSFSPTASLAIYDISGNSWSTGAPLPQATGDYAIGLYQNRYVYVIGGYSGSADLSLVQIYDTTTDTWAAGTPIGGTAVAGARGGIIGNRIVVVGGYSQILGGTQDDVWTGTIDPTNPTVITWVQGADYPGGPAGRLGSGVPLAIGPALAGAQLNFVFFTGGDPNGQGTAVKNDSWAYDFNDNSWKTAPNKPTGVSNINDVVGVAHAGKCYMVSTGGYDGNVVVGVNEWLSLGDETTLPVELIDFAIE
jgi:N-acetylneuraminic acid mutarotase